MNASRSPARRWAAPIAVLVLGAATARAEWHELPRSTAATPVQAHVVCRSTICEVAEHCARFDAWDTVADADFAREWSMVDGQMITTPKRASIAQRCILSVRQGEPYFMALRYYREKEGETWRTVSMSRDWSFRQIRRAVAPRSAHLFSDLVLSKRMCLDAGCAEYYQFEPGWTIVHRRPTAPRTRQGGYNYRLVSEAVGALTYAYDDTDTDCWVDLEFQAETSGTYELSCEDDTVASGSWHLRNR